MAESDDEIADISNALLDSRLDVKGDIFSFDEAPPPKRKKFAHGAKVAIEGVDDLLGTVKSKPTGSSFKSMGHCIQKYS
jgi:hypothetical protein